MTTEKSNIGNFKVEVLPADTLAEDIFKDMPYVPMRPPEMSVEDKAKFKLYTDRMRRTAELLDARKIPHAHYVNERAMAYYCKQYGEQVVYLTPYEALECADKAHKDSTLYKDYMRLANCLEFRMTYDIRAF